MAKRKNKDPGRTRQVHPQRSFENIVADATLTRLSGYIDGEVSQLGQGLLQRQQQSIQGLVIRLVVLEELLMEKFSFTKDDLALRVAAIQDRFDGFDGVESEVEAGDRVRIDIKTKTEDQTEYQGSSRLLVENAGSGRTVGPELESALLGMKAGETKTVLFGKDNSLQAELTVNKVSRAQKAPEAQAEAAPQEAPNASADAG